MQQRDSTVPRRWTLHGLNNGAIFGATYHGVRTLPRPVSYAIGDAGTWLAWRLMRQSRAALIHNLGAIFPAESPRAVRRRALSTYRSYARDAIDFLRALHASTADAAALFQLAAPHRQLFEDLLSKGRGIILVSGHYGNWEMGGLLVRALGMPLTIVAMTEASAQVNRIRRDIRDSMGADTLEVRRSLDTALQIRRRLGENRIVAMLVDRHLGRDRVPVTMFGRHAWFLRTPLLMGVLTGAPILPCFIERIGPGRFAATPGLPIHVDGDRPRDDAIQAAAQEIADGLAARIRAHPDYWYHFYRYWDAQSDAYAGLD